MPVRDVFLILFDPIDKKKIKILSFNEQIIQLLVSCWGHKGSLFLFLSDRINALFDGWRKHLQNQAIKGKTVNFPHQSTEIKGSNGRFWWPTPPVRLWGQDFTRLSLQAVITLDRSKAEAMWPYEFHTCMRRHQCHMSSGLGLKASPRRWKQPTAYRVVWFCSFTCFFFFLNQAQTHRIKAALPSASGLAFPFSPHWEPPLFSSSTIKSLSL